MLMLREERETLRYRKIQEGGRGKIRCVKQSYFTFLLLFLSWLPICRFSLFVFHSLLVGSRWQRMSWFCTSFSLMVSYIISVLEGWAKLHSFTHEVDTFKERQWVVAHLPFMFSNDKCPTWTQSNCISKTISTEAHQKHWRTSRMKLIVGRNTKQYSTSFWFSQVIDWCLAPAACYIVVWL